MRKFNQGTMLNDDPSAVEFVFRESPHGPHYPLPITHYPLPCFIRVHPWFVLLCVSAPLRESFFSLIAVTSRAKFIRGSSFFFLPWLVAMKDLLGPRAPKIRALFLRQLPPITPSSGQF